MRGRSPSQQAAYEARLSALAALLQEPMTVRQIRNASRGRRRPATATILSRIEALRARGIIVRGRKRRGRIPGKPGQRERMYWIGS